MKGRLFLILPLLFLAGCRPGFMAGLDFARSQPKAEDIVGVWTPDKATLRDIRERGHYASVETKIILRKDGAFSISNIPDWWSDGFGYPHGKFESSEGKWEFRAGKSLWKIWELCLITPKGNRQMMILHQKAPYSIFIYVGDPDNDDAMIFERTSSE
ncbi:MAG: hypothetical protein ABI615_13265 [Chthoniobacterales bacterium]